MRDHVSAGVDADATRARIAETLLHVVHRGTAGPRRRRGHGRRSA
jgi:hypothetical protein